MEYNFSASHEERWRAEDNEQRVLNNARSLWNRFVLRTRRDVEERAAQVRNLSTLSALVAGFAMASFLEFNFDVSGVNEGLMLAYGITTALVAAANTLCMAACQLLGASIVKLPEVYMSKTKEAHFMLQCREFALRYTAGSHPPEPRRNFQNLWELRCKGEWQRAFWLFSIGIPLFLVNMALAAWIKFTDFTPAAITMSVILAVALVCLILLEWRWVRRVNAGTPSPDALKHLRDTVPPMGLPYDWYLPPRAWPTGLAYTDAAVQSADDTSIGCDGRDSDELDWRAQDTAQRFLENARYLWLGFIGRTQDSVEEHLAQLRGLAFAAGVMDSFAMSSLLQLTFDVSQYRKWHLNGFGLTLGITVSLMTVCLAMCTFINFSIVKTRAQLVSEGHEAQFIQRCHGFATRYYIGRRPPAPLRTFSQHWQGHCEGESRRALLMFMTGVSVFQLNLIFAAWIKFPPPHQVTAYAMSAILGVGLVWLQFILIRWAPHAMAKVKRNDLRAEPPPKPVGLPFDWHLPPMQYKPNWEADQAAEAGSKLSADVPTDDGAGSIELRLTEARMVELLHEWREEDMRQTTLENANFLWDRFVSRNINDLEMHQEQLNTVAELSSIILGFMMISFLQFTFDTKETAPHLQIFFSVSAALTVSANACAMTVCGLMMENILDAASEFISPTEQARFVYSCLDYAERYQAGMRPPRPSRDFGKYWELHCEMEWRKVFKIFSYGVPIFVLNAIVSSWILWPHYAAPPATVTVIFAMGILYLIFSHVRWVRNLFAPPSRGVEEIPPSAGLPFDWHLPPVDAPLQSMARDIAALRVIKS